MSIPQPLEQLYKNIIHDLELIDFMIITRKHQIDQYNPASPNKINLINNLDILYMHKDVLLSIKAILNEKLAKLRPNATNYIGLNF